jgi:hypothetical protein
MIAEPNAKIFLAEKRLKLENPFNQNFTTYLPEQIDLSRKTVVGVSSSLSDDILKGGISLLVEVKADSWVVFVPYIGDLILRFGQEYQLLLAEGEVMVKTFKKGELYEIRNPSPDDHINFFQLRFFSEFSHKYEVSDIQMAAYPNAVRSIVTSGSTSISIGLYEDRKKEFIP